MQHNSVWWRRSLVVLLVTVIAVSPSAWAKDDSKGGNGPGPLGSPTDQTTFGWVLVPTPDAGRVFSPMTARGITHFYVAATPGATFMLGSTDGTSVRSCTLGLCFQTGDFDVTFFQEKNDGSTDVTARYAMVGDETGVVPEGSTFGLVYLKTPATRTTSKGFEFAYTEFRP